MLINFDVAGIIAIGLYYVPLHLPTVCEILSNKINVIVHVPVIDKTRNHKE